MPDEKDTVQASVATTTPSVRFKDMNLGQKLVHLGKSVAFFLTLGFAFPNIFIE
jgi:hypothetical protein